MGRTACCTHAPEQTKRSARNRKRSKQEVGPGSSYPDSQQPSYQAIFAVFSCIASRTQAQLGTSHASSAIEHGYYARCRRRRTISSVPSPSSHIAAPYEARDDTDTLQPSSPSDGDVGSVACVVSCATGETGVGVSCAAGVDGPCAGVATAVDVEQRSSTSSLSVSMRGAPLVGTRARTHTVCFPGARPGLSRNCGTAVD